MRTVKNPKNLKSTVVRRRAHRAPQARVVSDGGPDAAKPARRTQAERSEQMRVRILDAAVRVLADKGYAGFRTADVATVAGVSRGAQTHHFPTKDALVIAAVEHVFRTAALRGTQRATHVRSVDEALRELLEDSRDFFFSELFLIAMDLAILEKRKPFEEAQIRQISRAHRLPVEAAWRDAMVTAGVPVDLVDDLLMLTLSIVRGLAVRKLLADDPPGFRRALALWRAIVVDYLRAGARNTRPPSGHVTETS